jgi:azurin
MKPAVLLQREIFMVSRALEISLLALVLVCPGIALAQAPQPSVQERVAVLKATFAASQANLRQYEWIETTVVSLNGEEKSRKQQRCYYGADGVLQKVLVDASPPPPTKPGLRGRIIANKTAEMTDYMKSAVSLVKSYVPPDPARIQASQNAGKVSIQVLDPGKRAQVNFRDYQKPGDNLAVVINLANNVVAGIGVSSYLDSPTDVVTLDATMSQLNDGTIYTSDITLNAAAKNLTVTVQNTGYRKTN